VYVAALAPAEGETVADVFYRAKPHPEAPHLQPDAHGLIWMPAGGFARAAAHKASWDQTTILEAVQRPIAVKCIQEKAPVPAWKTKPSWFLLAEEDRMIMSEAVVAVILEAAQATLASRSRAAKHWENL
jgi:hypothetical protein